MAKARRGRKAKAASQDISFEVTPAIQAAIDAAKQMFDTVEIVGDVKNGKLELDPKVLAALAKKTSSTIAFIALNAPFRTKALTCAL